MKTSFITSGPAGVWVCINSIVSTLAFSVYWQGVPVCHDSGAR